MNTRTLATHVLRAMAEAQSEGRSSDLDALVEALGVRRVDIRKIVTQLHQEGHVDALRMRLTLSGFALGRAFIGQELPALRVSRTAAIAAA